MSVTYGDPDNQSPEQAKADRDRGNAIWRGMVDYVQANPGMSHATAYHLLMQKRPELFTDDQGRQPFERDKLTSANRKKQQAIRDEIAKMQEAEPDLSFTVAWRRLMKQKPDLFRLSHTAFCRKELHYAPLRSLVPPPPFQTRKRNRRMTPTWTSNEHQENELVLASETLSPHKAIRPRSASHGNRLRLLCLACC